MSIDIKQTRTILPLLIYLSVILYKETQHGDSGVSGQAAMPRVVAAKHTGKGNVPLPYLLNLSTPAKENLLRTRTVTL